VPRPTDAPARWYRDAVIYQVDVHRFCDAGSDHRGDIRGVIDGLDHVAALGATCLWLLPVHPSGGRDGGYDVTDHLAVDPAYGDLGDLALLLDAADARGLRVIVDLVVQHTSDQHPWFREARRDPGSPYRDYYIWTDDPELDPATTQPVFPTVEDSVWTWDEAAGRYYRHAFYSHEPDLDTANPRVVDEIERIVSFWLRLGVSGFRVDAAPYLVERAGARAGAEDGRWLLERLRTFVHRRREDAVLVLEVDEPPTEAARYFSTDHGNTLLLDFWTNNHQWLAHTRRLAEPLERALRAQPAAPAGSAYANFLRNHDELDLERIGDDEQAEVMEHFAPEQRMRAYGRGIRRRLGPLLGFDDRRIAMAFAVMLSLPGTPVLLYGDEVALDDDLDREERMAVRVPMRWDVVADQAGAPRSLLGRVSELVRARTGLGVVGDGGCEVLALDAPSVLALRYAVRGGSVVLLANLAGTDASATVRGALTDGPGRVRDLVADAVYAAPVGGDGRVPLGPYGYRWLMVEEER